MGQSTDAILFYGIDLGEPDPYDRPSVYDLIERLEEEPGGWNLQRELEKKYGVRIGRHCSREYPMFYIAEKEHEYRAWRGSHTRINPAELITPRLRSSIGPVEQLLADEGVEFDLDDIGWYLVSWWG